MQWQPESSHFETCKRVEISFSLKALPLIDQCLIPPMKNLLFITSQRRGFWRKEYPTKRVNYAHVIRVKIWERSLHCP